MFNNKNLAKIILLMFFALGFTSCKKDYLCKCEMTNWDEYGTPSTEWLTITYNDPEYKARRKCKSIEKEEKNQKVDCDFSELE
jgi:hypothetical protein